MLPGPPPDLLVQVLAVGGPSPRGEEGEEQRGVAAIELFERITGRAQRPV